MFKKIITIVLLGVMMATLMSLLLGCEDVDSKTVAAIQDQLSEKYGKTFTVHALGNRIGYDTATAFVFADDDPSLLFTARLNKSYALTFDDYAYRIVCRKTEAMFDQTFKQFGMEGISFCNFEKLDNSFGTEVSPIEYASATSSTYASVTFATNGRSTVSAEKILEAIDVFHSAMDALDLRIRIFILTEDDYSQVYDSILKETQSFTHDRLSAYGAKDSISEVGFLYTAAGCSLSIEDISAMLNKGAE